MTVKPRLNVDALARLEMAREKARIAGRKPPLPSRLEQAAQAWKAQQEHRQRFLFQPGAEPSVVALQRMALQARPDGRRTDGEVVWKAQRWGDEDKRKPMMLNAAMVSRIAGRLRAREWARAMGKTRARPTTFSLEKWAETWRQQTQSETTSPTGEARES